MSDCFTSLFLAVNLEKKGSFPPCSSSSLVLPEVQAGSMPLRRIRCGFGVKYFGFLHIQGGSFFFLT